MCNKLYKNKTNYYDQVQIFFQIRFTVKSNLAVIKQHGVDVIISILLNSKRCH